MPPVKTYKLRKKTTATQNKPISRKKNARKPGKIRPVVTESMERAILSCDSLEVCTEDTFDKLIRSYREKKTKDDDIDENKSTVHEISEVSLNKIKNVISSTPNVLNCDIADNNISHSFISPISINRPFVQPRYARNGIRGRIVQFEDIKCQKIDSKSIIVIEDSDVSSKSSNIDSKTSILLKVSYNDSKELQNEYKKLILNKEKEPEVSTNFLKSCSNLSSYCNELNKNESNFSKPLKDSIALCSTKNDDSNEQKMSISSKSSIENDVFIEKSTELSGDLNQMDVDESIFLKSLSSKSTKTSLKDTISDESTKSYSKIKEFSVDLSQINSTKPSLHSFFDELTKNYSNNEKNNKFSVDLSQVNVSKSSRNLLSKDLFFMDSTRNESTKENVNDSKNCEISLNSSSKDLFSTNDSTEITKNEAKISKRNLEDAITIRKSKELIVDITKFDFDKLKLSKLGSNSSKSSENLSKSVQKHSYSLRSSSKSLTKSIEFEKSLSKASISEDSIGNESKSLRNSTRSSKLSIKPLELETNLIESTTYSINSSSSMLNSSNLSRNSTKTSSNLSKSEKSLELNTNILNSPILSCDLRNSIENKSENEVDKLKSTKKSNSTGLPLNLRKSSTNSIKLTSKSIKSSTDSSNLISTSPNFSNLNSNSPKLTLNLKLQKLSSNSRKSSTNSLKLTPTSPNSTELTSKSCKSSTISNNLSSTSPISLRLRSNSTKLIPNLSKFSSNSNKSSSNSTALTLTSPQTPKSSYSLSKSACSLNSIETSFNAMEKGIFDAEINKSVNEMNVLDFNFKEATVNLTLLDVKPLILKPGKQWRRSLVNQTRGTNQRGYVPTYTIIDEGLDESSTIFEISAEESIRVEDQEDFEEIFQRTINLEDENDENKENFDGNKEEFGEDKGLKKKFFAQERKSFIGFRKDFSAKEIVLKKCEQKAILDFQECYPESSLKNCHKIGEGLYGEVFLLKKSPQEVSVLKIIPIEGSYPVNGEPQKKFAEILSEITIQSELSSLRDNNEKNRTATFSRLKKISCVRGRYPDRLTELWELYQEINGTENDHPMIFEENQIFIVLELENSGRDLESFVFYNAKQSWSVFKQIACGLAVAENCLEFEHRDLHWGNVLVLCKEPKEYERFTLDGEDILIENSGVKATIIDYTMSRIKKNGICMFNDLKNDPDLFKGEGDYQFEIYRLMKNSNGNNWEKFDSYSNVLWLHYILGKMIKGVHYRSEKTRVHFNGINAMKELYKVLLSYKSVKEIINDVIKF